MAKKFGKFLLLSAAVGAIAAGAYYYMHNNKDESSKDDEDFDDFDEFSEDLDNAADNSSGERSYVSLNLDETKAESESPAATPESASKDVETVEEFFDDDDSLDA